MSKRPIREFIFVDAETTGLLPMEDELVELTYAGLDDEPKTLYFGVMEVPDFINTLIKFSERGIAGKLSPKYEIDEFQARSANQTMVAANPGFDESFLNVNGLWSFHYRKLDIESYAMKALKLDYVPGMKDVYDILRGKGYDITAPDHTSLNDVLCLRDAFKILREL